jgi:mitotic spindle assembly checkpoint protein MAD1
VANMSTFVPDDEEVAELRSTHTQLLEENGATIALLRSRDAELTDVKESNEALRSSLTNLQDKLRLEKERSTRHEHAAALASREVSFLKALVVRQAFI